MKEIYLTVSDKLNIGLNDDLVIADLVFFGGKAGASMNTKPEGWMDFNKETLKLDMKLIGLKDYSKINAIYLLQVMLFWAKTVL